MPLPATTGDPVADLIVAGRANTVEEAEALYIDEHLHELVRSWKATSSPTLNFAVTGWSRSSWRAAAGPGKTRSRDCHADKERARDEA